MNTEITVDRRAVETEVDSKGNTCPGRVLGSTIEALLSVS